MPRIAPTLALSILFSLCAALRGQIPAFMNGQRTVRYEVSPNIYHVAVPLYLKADGSEVSLPAADTHPAVRWLVTALKARMTSTPIDPSELIVGFMEVTESSVEFVPNDPKDAGSRFLLPSSEVDFTHRQGSESGMIGSKAVYYQFAFENICFDCAAETQMPEPSHPEKRDEEFQQFAESLKNFQAVWLRIREASEQTAFEVNPKNQPTPADVAGAMMTYAAMNHRLAEICPEAAQSCLRSYERYQSCSAGIQTSVCGPPPVCVAACTISGKARDDLKAGVCFKGDQIGASPVLFPDWTSALLKDPAWQPAKLSTMEASDVLSRGFSMTGFMGLPAGLEPGTAGAPALVALGPSTCSVEAGYKRARLAQVGKITGLVGAGTKTASKRPAVGGVPFPETAAVGPDGRVHLSAIAAGSQLATSVAPSLPALAVAARIAGSVTVHVVVAKDGRVSEITVVNGIDLLSAAVVDAVKQWTYRPYLVNGKPVEMETNLTWNFQFADQLPPR